LSIIFSPQKKPENLAKIAKKNQKKKKKERITTKDTKVTETIF